MLYDLALKLQYVGNLPTAQIHFDAIRQADPSGQTAGGAQLLLQSLVANIRKATKNPNDRTSYDLSSLCRYLARRRPAAIQFVAWDWIGNVEAARSDQPRAIKAWRTAAKHLPAKRQSDWPVGVITSMWTARSSVTRDDGKFMRKLANRCFEAQLDRLRELAAAARASDTGNATGHEPGTDEQMFAQIVATARARELAGERRLALEVIDLALTIEPGNGAFQSLKLGLQQKP